MRMILLAIAFLMCAFDAAAEPSPEIETLMNEPASLLDLGILRCNQQLVKYKETFQKFLDKNYENVGLYSLKCDYDWEKNRLSIKFNFKVDAEHREDREFKKILACQAIGFADCSFVGLCQPMELDAHSGGLFGIELKQFFGHYGYSTSSLDEFSWEAFFDLFYVEVTFHIFPFAEKKLVNGRVMYFD